MPIVSAPRRGVSKGAACPSMPPSRRVVVIVLLSVGPKDCGEKVGPLGFEPRLTDPKSAVLPLDEGPVRLRWWKLMRGANLSPCANASFPHCQFSSWPARPRPLLPRPHSSFGGSLWRTHRQPSSSPTATRSHSPPPDGRSTSAPCTPPIRAPSELGSKSRT